MCFTTTRILNKEDIKIPPEDLIESALYHQSVEEYDIAEQDLITALRNVKGQINGKAIVSNVKTALIHLYTSWANYSANNNDFYNAEYVLKKQEKIYSNKELFKDLYEIWGDALASEGKILSAENRYIRALIMEIELGQLDFTSHLITKIKCIKLLSNSPKDYRVATRLYIMQNERSFIIRYIVLFIIGLIYLIISNALSYFTLQSFFNPNPSFVLYGFEIITFEIALSPAIILSASPIKYEKKYLRDKRFIIFHWLFCIINIIIGTIAIYSNVKSLLLINYFLSIAFSLYCVLKSFIMLCLYIKNKKTKNKKKTINKLIKNMLPDENLAQVTIDS